jgi:hypothetical protein
MVSDSVTSRLSASPRRKSGNKPNGFYCSAKQDDYAYERRDKTYVSGILCENSGFQTCQGGAGSRAGLTPRGTLACL